MKGKKKNRYRGVNDSRRPANISKPQRPTIGGGKPEVQKSTIRAKVFAWYDSKSPIVKFAAKFGALMLLFYAFSVTPFCERVFWPANLKANVWISNFILQGLNQHTVVSGDAIKFGTHSFILKRGCDATEPAWLLAAAVISFPAPLWRKLLGVVAGTLLLLVLNLLRVISLFFVVRNHPSLYDTLHLTLFPAVFIVLAMIIWGGWVVWAGEGNRLKTDAKI